MPPQAHRLDRRAFLKCSLLAGLAPTALAATAGAPGEERAPGMIVIASGEAIIGTSETEAAQLAGRHGVDPSWFGLELPRRRVPLRGFLLARHPVTHAQFARFLRETGYAHPYHREILALAESRPTHPVTRVAFQDALDYAAWAGCRLPSEAEWEYAARGPEGRLYPWGEAWDPALCNNNHSGTLDRDGACPVDAHDHVASPFGVKDLAGNVLEWTTTPLGSMCQVLKGGFWHQRAPWQFRPACRGMSQYRTNRQRYIGFRLARDLDA